jgi:phage terminase large subunit-like protein
MTEITQLNFGSASKDAPWLSVLEAELLAFPQVKHDDQADSISQALAYEIGGYDTTMAWANYL